MADIRLITLDPGHFHAALVQRELYPGVSRRVHVYAPLGPDLIAHTGRIARFELGWELEIHASPDCLERMIAERPGNVVVLSGRNRLKMDRIAASVRAGLNVLADKPWIIESSGMPMLEQTFDAAERAGLVAYDIMTERYEITSILQREIVRDREIFGEPLGVYMESVHHILKLVAGAPNLRPLWFFDIREQGEALADVGTHLVDLVQWTLFPEQAIDWRTDIEILEAKRWPTTMSAEQLRRVTGEPVQEGLDYYCNTQVSYRLRGIPVQLDVLWRYEGPGDSHLAVYRGSRARVEVRDDQLCVTGADRRAIENRLAKYSGVKVESEGPKLWVRIPNEYRVGHEAHFAQVTRQFLQYLENPKSMPAWEKPNMLAKYYVTTKGVEKSRG